MFVPSQPPPKPRISRLNKILLSGAGIVVIAFMGLASWGQWATARTADLCLLNYPLPAHTILLVDRTDPLNAAQAQALTSLADRIVEGLPNNGRFSIYLINQHHETLPEKKFSLCSPGNKATANPIFENPEMLQKQFENQFKGPVDQLMAQLTLGEVAERSPLVETLAFIAKLPDFGPSIPDRKLIIYSDMLQNSDHYSHYGKAPPLHLSELRASPKYSTYINNILPDFSGVNVSAIYVQRKAYAKQQTPRHQWFWDEFFQATQAQSFSWSLPDPTIPPSLHKALTGPT